MSGPVVLGVDLGTTATKVVAGTRDGTLVHQVERGYPLRNTDPGEAVQDPVTVRDAALAAVAECAAWASEHDHEVAGLSFSAAMHTLVGLDADDAPVTPAYTWADTRSEEIARRLRAEPAARDLHRATGTPVHTQSVMVKLAWLGAEGETGAVRTWCGLKDFVAAAFTGELATDHSMASGTGLQDMRTLDWHPQALEFAGVDAAHLPPLVAPTATTRLTAEAAKVTGLPSGMPVIWGGGDGPLANLGVGALEPGVAALSLGTSGALRVMRAEPGVDEQCRTFCYALDDGLWAVGGAISNGGVVAKWASDAFGVEIPELLDEAAAVAPGADGLLALPYLLGERAPWWETGLTGALIGLRRDHGRAEITRAFVEGVAQQFALVRAAVEAAGDEVHTVRATGGGFRSRVWAEAISSALELDLELAEGSGGSALGSVLLGWRALGEWSALADAAALITPSRSVRVDPEAARLSARRRPVVDRMHQVLRDVDWD